MRTKGYIGYKCHYKVNCVLQNAYVEDLIPNMSGNLKKWPLGGSGVK
jgi:hypothetical protein